ncbi:MAG: 16S rRNA (guanine(527)-N(7))-methyltransferase RsmG [Thermodesulfovibrio sp.]|nr:16S rRNA (guanine(527)-N(7))-methyltransferase RsmG [Thermodesulfovibrio sp.]
MTENEKLLSDGIKQIGIHDTPGQIAAFTTYLSELKKWSRAYNLTGLRTDRDIIIKNFLDSVLFCKVLPDDLQSLADIGSGAGFPGIPIKIMRPDLRVMLFEPTQKKALFLRHICHTLGLQDIQVIDKRAEDVSGITVDALVTRALFTVGDFVKKAGHMLNNDGIFILSKGPKLEVELAEAVNLKATVTDATLPFEKTVRHLVVVKKQGV